MEDEEEKEESKQINNTNKDIFFLEIFKIEEVMVPLFNQQSGGSLPWSIQKFLYIRNRKILCIKYLNVSESDFLINCCVMFGMRKKMFN